MIATEDRTVEVESTMTAGRTAKMKIADHAMARIMGVLTRLYENPRKAVLREYATNGMDAHRQVGQTRPIEVTLPNQLSQYVKIKDWGVGLTEDNIFDIYSQYGASTKLETNDQVGMLGLGCKSALAYTHQFTLVSNKDGVQVQVLVSRSSQGGNMQVLSSLPTDEPNGTEIVIPAKLEDRFEFERMATSVFRFWKEGTVLVNGETPKQIDGLWLTDKLVVTRDVPQDYVVMGDVAYPASLDHNMSDDHKLVAYVPIGTLDFTPSREALEDTDYTNATLKSVVEDFNAAAADAIQSMIDATDSAVEAVALANKWHAVMPMAARKQDGYTWKGKDVPTKFAREHTIKDYEDKDVLAPLKVQRVPFESHIMSRAYRENSVPARGWDRTVWVHGYTGAAFTAPQKKKLVKWCGENGLGRQVTADGAYNPVSQFILLDAAPDEIKEWLDPKMIVEWSAIQAIKLPRTYTGGGGSWKTIPGSYECYVATGGQTSGEVEVEADNIDQTLPVYYVMKLDYHGAWAVSKLLKRYEPDHTVVILSENRVKKFLRNFPNARYAQDRVRELQEEWAKGLTDRQRLALTLDGDYDARDLRGLDPSKVDDPEIKKVASAARLAKKDNLVKLRSEFVQAGGLGVDAVEWENPLDGYPLWSNYDFRNHPEHMYIYLNAAYAAQQKGA